MGGAKNKKPGTEKVPVGTRLICTNDPTFIVFRYLITSIGDKKRFCLSVCVSLSVFISSTFTFTTLLLFVPSTHVSTPHTRHLDRALLVGNQYVVSFDGLLLPLPAGSCPVVLAQDRSRNPAFTLLLLSPRHAPSPPGLLLSPRRAPSPPGLLLTVNHGALSISPDGQVCVHDAFSLSLSWRIYRPPCGSSRRREPRYFAILAFYVPAKPNHFLRVTFKGAGF